MRKRNIAIIAAIEVVITLVGLFLVLNLTNPTDSGPLGMLSVLVLIYAVTYGFIVLCGMFSLYIYQLLVPIKASTTSHIKETRRMRKTLAICAVLSATPMLLLSISSIGKIGFVDISLIIATEFVAIFYITKRF